MLTSLQTKEQITLPKCLIEKLGISLGDNFEISEREGVICLTPVVYEIASVWSKEFIDLQGTIADETFAEPEDISFSEREKF